MINTYTSEITPILKLRNKNTAKRDIKCHQKIVIPNRKMFVLRLKANSTNHDLWHIEIIESWL